MRRPVVAGLFGVLAVPLAAPAQDLRWSVAERGALLYRRELKIGQQKKPESAQYSLPWYGDPDASAVLAGELDERRQATTEPLNDVRGLFAFACLDLTRSKGGRLQWDVAGIGQVAPCRIEATYGPPGDDGSQTVEVRVSAEAAAAKGRPAPPVSAWQPRLQGTATGTRVLDRAAGRVASLRGSMTLTLDYAASGEGAHAQPARSLELRIDDEWTFDLELTPGSPEFRSRVAQAIRDSTASLVRGLDRRPAPRDVPAEQQYHDSQPGELALRLLAAVKGGADPRGEELGPAFADLRTMPIYGTYSLAVAILAIEALYTPPTEWVDLREGRLKAPAPRQLTDGDRALVQKWTGALLDNIDQTVDQAYLRRWHYGPSQHFDNSNTQYALLGLYAAQLCGVEVSPQVWTAAANHWLDCLIRAGEPGQPLLPSYADVEREEKGGRGTRARGPKVPCVGWAYGKGGEPTGSMTSAGVTGLTLCAAALRGQKKGAPKLLREIDEAARGGFLWLERNLSVRRNPGPTGSWNNWVFYWLYGLERTCEFSQVARLGERDWYFEGAIQLLGQQRADGSWGSATDTCFGLLFLKKSALPPVTGR